MLALDPLRDSNYDQQLLVAFCSALQRLYRSGTFGPEPSRLYHSIFVQAIFGFMSSYNSMDLAERHQVSLPSRIKL